ncbi:hypothetical protein ACP70R_023701 [Stipagrostis hirtigluma subsp. patula]
MAPACVLFDRYVPFLDDPVVAIAAAREGPATTMSGGARAAVPSREAMSEGIAAYLRAMKHDPQVAEPPMVTYLSMVRPSPSDSSVPQYGRQLHSGIVASADKNLLVLYAGPYRPGNSSQGCYLVYDANAGSSSTVPGIPFSASYCSPGRGTVITAAADGSFVLAELLVSFRPAPAGAWVHKSGRLLVEACPPAHIFKAHMSFAVGSRSLLCWVDLLYGLLLCDAAVDGDDPGFRFVPLPDGHAIETDRRRQFRPEEFHSVGCVAGAVRFAAMDGYLRRRVPGDQVTLTTWTLDMRDLARASWTKDTELCLGDLWEDKGQ